MEVLSQAATVPGYSLGLQCSHSASAPTRSHLTRQLGSWGASELRAEAGIGQRLGLHFHTAPSREDTQVRTRLYRSTSVQESRASTVAMHPTLGPEQRPSSGNPRLLALVSAMLIGSPAGPCIPARLNPWPRPPPSFFPGPHNFISSFQRNAVNACVLAAPRLPTRRALSARLRQPPVLELAARQCLDKPKQPTHQDLYHRSVITASTVPVAAALLLPLLPLPLPLSFFLFFYFLFFTRSLPPGLHGRLP